MDIALGVSMTPTTVRVVLVEGKNADGVTVDHDVIDIAPDQSSATAPEQVLSAILGTRESAVEGGHRMVATGVTWRSHDDAARLRAALKAHDIDDVVLVSELHAAGVLAQVAGRTVGYRRTALMFLDGDTATLSVVDTADGAITRVERQDLHTEDAVGRLTSMVSTLETLDEPPQGVFVVGSGLSVSALKLQLESATSLPVSAPDEAGLALARGAALASARTPMFEAATVAGGYVQDGDAGTTAGAVALAYSDVAPEDDPDPEEFEPAALVVPVLTPPARKPLLLVGSAMTGLFVLGVAALVVSLAVSIRPTVDQRPSPAEAVIVPTRAPAPLAAVPAMPSPAPALETIPAPVPVVQQAPVQQVPVQRAPAPRTIFVEAPAAAPAPPAAPALAPAAPPPPPAAPPPAAPAPVVAPVPVAPIVIPAPVAPPIIAPVFIPNLPSLPRIQWPWEQQSQWPRQQQTPQAPQWDPPAQWDPQPQWPGQQHDPKPQWDPQPQWPGQQHDPKPQWPGQQQTPQAPQWDPQPQWPGQQQAPKPQWDPPKQQQQQQPGSGSGSGGGGSKGSDSLWPWPNWGN